MSNRRLVPLNVVALPSLPASGHRPGDLVYNETDGNLYVSDGTSWTNLGGGSDGPYSSAAFANDFAAQSTDGLAEGTSNLYFTDQRALDATSLAYDPAGSAANAQAAAQTYADNAASTAVSNLVDAAPETLDTLNELASALGDDPNFATSVTNQIATKADATALADHESSTTSVHGIANTADLETQAGAQAKADAAQSQAQAYADSLATNYDPAGSASAAETAANAYTDAAISSFDALPDQTGNAGKYLTTDGASTSWLEVDAFPDQAGNAGRYLTTDGSTTSWANVNPAASQFEVRYYPPESPSLGTCYFDRSLNSPVWWDGSQWWYPGMAAVVFGGTSTSVFDETLIGGVSSTSYEQNLSSLSGGSSVG